MSSLSFQHLIDSSQITDNDIELLISRAERYRKDGFAKVFANEKSCRGKIIATLFFEPSTRTRLSFESAMLRLNGQIITLENGETSSVKKGESLFDTGRIISSYADIIVMRHPKIGSVAELAKYATVPVINAGDGANQHPTQSLVDLYTIFCEKKKLTGLKIGFLGDLKYSRTVHSLLNLIGHYSDNHYTLISHPSLALDQKKKKTFEDRGYNLLETSDLNSAIKDLDVLYITRIQQERFENLAEYEMVKNCYHIDEKILQLGRPDLCILHPLPRINEIDPIIDNKPQAKYFAQAEYAVYMRMALLSLILS